MPFILEAIGIVRRELRDDQAVVGFCGGVFTVAGYLVEGKPSRDFTKVKTLMYAEPEVWHALCDKLAETFARYVRAKVRRGRRRHAALRLVGGRALAADYDEFVRRTPRASSPRSTSRRSTSAPGRRHLLAPMSDAGGDVIGLDWRIPLDGGWSLVGDDRGVQGNLDGALLLGPWERIEAGTRDVLDRAAGRPGHIFNLGHGVLPDTDPAVLGRGCASSCTS